MEIKIDTIIGREIIDSRGNPTVEAEVGLSDGTFAKASVLRVRQLENLRRLNFVTVKNAISAKVCREPLKISTA